MLLEEAGLQVSRGNSPNEHTAVSRPGRHIAAVRAAHRTGSRQRHSASTREWAEPYLITAFVLSLPHLKPSALRHKDRISSAGGVTTAEEAPPLPEDRTVLAPPPQVHQLQAVVTATTEHLSTVVAQVQRGDSPLRRKLLNATPQPGGGDR